MIKQELVKRFSTWTYPLAFGLVAFSFLGKARSNRHEQFQNGALVAAIALSARGLGFYSTEAAGVSPAMEAVSYLVPAGLIVVFGFLTVSGPGTDDPEGLGAAQQPPVRYPIRLARTVSGEPQEAG
jgi:lipopolysaccharide export system permease protein